MKRKKLINPDYINFIEYNLITDTTYVHFIGGYQISMDGDRVDEIAELYAFRNFLKIGEQ